eukprot:6194702-Pyramimonas_sp.AAC.1
MESIDQLYRSSIEISDRIRIFPLWARPFAQGSARRYSPQSRPRPTVLAAVPRPPHASCNPQDRPDKRPTDIQPSTLTAFRRLSSLNHAFHSPRHPDGQYDGRAAPPEGDAFGAGSLPRDGRSNAQEGAHDTVIGCSESQGREIIARLAKCFNQSYEPGCPYQPARRTTVGF